MIDMGGADILIKGLTLDELEGLAKELSETLGIETAFRLSCRYGGQTKYFPKPEEFFKAVVKSRIRKEFAEGNISKRKLAEKYNLSRSTVRKWLAD